MAKHRVTLTKEERELLLANTKRGSHTAKKIIHSLILLNVDQGPHAEQPLTDEEVCKAIMVSMRTISRVRRRFVSAGLDATLNNAPTTRVYQKKMDDEAKARLLSLASSAPPKGFNKWSLRLLADRMVELNYVDGISHEAVRKTLKKLNLRLGKRSKAT